MLTFPALNSGAIAQYPLPVSYTSPTQVVRFIDGLDQRFSARGRTLRSWHVALADLSDTEIGQIENFFSSLSGQYSLFAFPDPYSGVTVPNCRLGESSLTTDYLSVDLASVSLWVVETNG